MEHYVPDVDCSLNKEGKLGTGHTSADCRNPHGQTLNRYLEITLLKISRGSLHYLLFLYFVMTEMFGTHVCDYLLWFRLNH